MHQSQFKIHLVRHLFFHLLAAPWCLAMAKLILHWGFNNLLRGTKEHLNFLSAPLQINNTYKLVFLFSESIFTPVKKQGTNNYKFRVLFKQVFSILYKVMMLHTSVQ